MIYIVNEGVRFGDPATMARITPGETVDPRQIYFGNTPRFESAAPTWLTHATAVRRYRCAVFGPG
jgi:hypothetical protein